MLSALETRPGAEESSAVRVRLPARLRAALDAASATEGDHPNRSEMVRRIVVGWLVVHGYVSVDDEQTRN